MSQMRILIVMLLALAFMLPAVSASLGINMFDFPALYMPSYGGDTKIQYNEIGASPIIFAPPSSMLMTGGYTGNHFMPKLETGTWTSSMKTSPINQLFVLMSHGINNLDQ